MEGNLISIGIMLVGAVLGAALAWLILRTKSNRSYQDGKADSVTEVATLQERLTSKDRELQKLQEASDQEAVEHARVKENNSILKADLEGERRAAHERNESFNRV